MKLSMSSLLRFVLGSAISLMLSVSAQADPDENLTKLWAGAECDADTGITTISYYAVGAQENADIRFSFDYDQIDSAAFVEAEGLDYLGSHPAPAGAVAGQKIIVRVHPKADWADGSAPGYPLKASIWIPDTCATKPKPAIELCTLVTLNPDMVSDFSDADNVADDKCSEFPQTIPAGELGVDGTYRLQVTNSGNQDLVEVRINAPDFGLFDATVPCNGGNMAAGDVCVINFGDAGFPSLKVADVCTAPGQVTKIATVDGLALAEGYDHHEHGEDCNHVEVTDEDPAIVECVVDPKIVLRKEVSLNGGPFLDANTPETGPSGELNADAEYRLVVENIGAETLINAMITDDMLGISGERVPGGPLLPGEIREIWKTDQGFGSLEFPNRCDSIGHKLNIASVKAWGEFSETKVESEDPAYVSCEEPQIELLKQVSLDGVNFFDADNAGDADVPVGIVGVTDATYRFIVTNIGSEDLINVRVVDTDLGIDQIIANLASGDSSIIQSGDTGFGNLYQPLRCGGTPGNKANIASVSANGADTGALVSDDNPANVRCITGPEIQLLKQVSIDGVNFFDADTPEEGPTGLIGADATYRLIVRNIGDEDLVNVRINDSTIFLVNAVVEDLPIGAEVVIDAGYTEDFDTLFYPGRCDSVGVHLNVARVDADGDISGNPVWDDDPANLNCDSPASCELVVDKTCLVEPSVGDDLLCTAGIAGTTLRYTGPDMTNATVTFEGDKAGFAEYVGVDLVSGVTVLTMPSQDGYTINSDNLGAKTTITINGEVEIIHTSCSAIYRAGQPAPLDKDTPNPSGSAKGDPSPNWYVVNFIQKDGIIIEGPSEGPDGPGLDNCVVPYGGANVHFTYKITNTGTTAMDLTSVLDSIAGEQLENPPVPLAAGEMLSLTGDPMFIDELSMMTVNVSGNVTGDDAATCEDADTVVVDVEPAPQLTCKELKPVTALSMVWDGPDGVDILTEAGQLFSNVQNGNKITFNTSGLGNDVDLTLSGAVNGSSVFHVSCSDQNMNGPEDCGSNQGSGKNNASGKITDFLLDAIIGEKGQMSCSLPNTGVVEPEDGGPVGGGLSASLKEIKGKEYKINVTNNGSATATMVRMTISWPDGTNGYVHEVKRGKDKIYHSHSSSSPLTIDTWEKGAKAREFKAGKTEELKINFESNADSNAANYTVEIEFDDGTVVTVL